MKTVMTLAMLVCAAWAMTGCEAIGYVADAVAGEGPPIEVTAEYRGLDNQTVAVIVNADLPVLYQFPTMQLEVGTAISQQIAANVPGVRVVNPKQIVEFQARNIYWSTATYDDLMKKLGVSRLIFVELLEFRTQEPGNSIMYRGVVGARVDVAEAESATPSDPTYSTLVTVAYPPDEPEGVPEADERTIRKGTLDLFSLAVGWKFYDHQEPRPSR